MNKPFRQVSGIVAGLLGLAAVSARADQWFSPQEVKETTNVFGKTTVVLRYDGLKRRNDPEYSVKIYQGGKLLAEHEGVGFSEVFADAENRYFVGVSNEGLVGTAWVVFDRDGKVLKRQKHDPHAVKFCEVSVTLLRQWYDEKQPEPQFKVEAGKLKEVSVRSCKGKRIALPLN